MSLDRRINAIATHNGGVVRRSQALEIGMTRGMIDARLRRGDWDRLGKGVYRLLPERDEFDSLRAATSALRDAVVSHRSAARLHGFWASRTFPTVTVHQRTTHEFTGVRVVRTADLVSDHRTVVEGLPVTAIERTIVDLASELSSARLRSVVDEVVASGRTSADRIAAMHRQVGRRGKPGTTRLRSVIDAVKPAAIPPSVFEARFRRLLESANFVDYEVEFPIPWSQRERFDLAFPAQRLAIELDSFRWHGNRGAFQDDRRRDRQATLHGWRVLRFTWQDLSNSPSSVVATVQLALESL